MKQYQFSLKDECMKEHNGYHPFLVIAKEEIPVPKEYLNQFEDGSIYKEDEFKIIEAEISTEFENDEYVHYENGTLAIPKQKVDDAELWKEFFDKIFDWNYGISNYLSKKDFINELQKHYTITRK